MLIKELVKSFKRNHPELDEAEFNELIDSDPTIVINERGKICGKYAVWIGNQYIDGKIKVGDIPELKAALTTYDKHKSHLKPIKEVKDLTELIDLVKDLSDDFKPSRCLSKGEQGLEKVYEDDEWIVYIPHTFEASRKIGGDTRWCTAASNGQSQFDYYTNKGPLYVNVRKSDGEKFQFHFETNQFMDKEDKAIAIKRIGLNDKVIDFYQSMHNIFKYFFIYDGIDSEVGEDCFYRVTLNSKVNFIYKIDGKLLSPTQWFNACDDFSCGYTVVELNQKYNWLGVDGQFLIPDQWFDWAGMLVDNIGVIEKNGKYSWIDLNGELVLPNYWFDEVGCFYNGMAAVCLGGKWNLIKMNGELLSPDQWFDNAYSVYEQRNYGVVVLKGKTNRIRLDGSFEFDSWLDNCPIMNDSNYNVNGICVGQLGGELIAIKKGKVYKIKELIDNYENR